MQDSASLSVSQKLALSKVPMKSAKARELILLASAHLVLLLSSIADLSATYGIMSLMTAALNFELSSGCEVCLVLPKVTNVQVVPDTDP